MPPAGAAPSTGSSTPGAAWTAGCISPGTRTTWSPARWPRSRASDRYRAPLVMEGGAIHTDGQGTLLVTEQCLLNRNRNPAPDEAARSSSCCAPSWASTAIIWLGRRRGRRRDRRPHRQSGLLRAARGGLPDLDGQPSRSAVAVSRDALERLKAARDARGRRFTVHKLPSPGPLRMTKAEAAGVQHRAGAKPRARGSAAGGFLCEFLHRQRRRDRAAARRAHRQGGDRQSCDASFRSGEVVGVPGREILLGGGNIHCITQQVPRAANRSRR